jgi:hypothetical protein
MLEWIDSASLRRLAGLYTNRAGIFKEAMGARNRGGRGLLYRPARLHRLAEFIPWNRFRGPIHVQKYQLRVVLPRWESIPGLLKGLHIRALDCCNVCNGMQSNTQTTRLHYISYRMTIVRTQKPPT